MGEEKYTVEAHMRVYDDRYGWFVTVRPDRDGGGICEIAWNDGDQSVQDERTITMPWAMAQLVAQMILSTTPKAREPNHA